MIKLGKTFTKFKIEIAGPTCAAKEKQIAMIKLPTIPVGKESFASRMIIPKKKTWIRSATIGPTHKIIPTDWKKFL